MVDRFREILQQNVIGFQKLFWNALTSLNNFTNDYKSQMQTRLDEVSYLSSSDLMDVHKAAFSKIEQVNHLKFVQFKTAFNDELFKNQSQLGEDDTDMRLMLQLKLDKRISETLAEMNEKNQQKRYNFRVNLVLETKNIFWWTKYTFFHKQKTFFSVDDFFFQKYKRKTFCLPENDQTSRFLFQKQVELEDAAKMKKLKSNLENEIRVKIHDSHLNEKDFDHLFVSLKQAALDEVSMMINQKFDHWTKMKLKKKWWKIFDRKIVWRKYEERRNIKGSAPSVPPRVW